MSNPSTPILFGIKNCDTVKKARKWLDASNIEHHFHDVRTDGLSAEQVQQWISAVGIDTLINKRSTTWKTLSDDEKASLNEQNAVALILENPTLFKRPLLAKDGTVNVGFKDAQYQAIF